MNKHICITGLAKLGSFISHFLSTDEANYDKDNTEFYSILKKSEIDNPWFTIENQKYALEQWANLITEEKINQWLEPYSFANQAKKIGLVLAGNIPMVGFHDVISVILSGHIPMIKLSSKDKVMIPFLLKKWNEFSGGILKYDCVEKLSDFDAVIATGSNNTAKYLEYYFSNSLSLIRKNRTSIAVLKGDETDEEIIDLSNDIFRYFGLGCRNVTRLFIPKDFALERLFENFMNFKEVINHHKYANNYDYNRAIFLLNQEKFWDNNFVLLKEDDKLFSPLGVIHFSRYESIEEVKQFIDTHQQDLQCVVAKPELTIENSVPIGTAQCPSLDTYADHIDTMRFLEVI